MATNLIELSEPVGWLVAPCSSVVGWLPDLVTVTNQPTILVSQPVEKGSIARAACVLGVTYNLLRAGVV